jgi:hypothetical protein
MDLLAVFDNRVLGSALIAWGLAQILKLPLEYFRTGGWNWGILASAGGMPSSHSALIVGATHAIGLYVGFDSPLFALAVALAMIVTYDAAGVRRQAGFQAQKINMMVKELFTGHAISEKDLREVLGHSPLEVAGGILLGIVVTQLLWFFWR